MEFNPYQFDAMQGIVRQEYTHYDVGLWFQEALSQQQVNQRKQSTKEQPRFIFEDEAPKQESPQAPRFNFGDEAPKQEPQARFNFEFETEAPKERPKQATAVVAKTKEEQPKPQPKQAPAAALAKPKEEPPKIKKEREIGNQLYVQVGFAFSAIYGQLIEQRLAEKITGMILEWSTEKVRSLLRQIWCLPVVVGDCVDVLREHKETKALVSAVPKEPPQPRQQQLQATIVAISKSKAEPPQPRQQQLQAKPPQIQPQQQVTCLEPTNEQLKEPPRETEEDIPNVEPPTAAVVATTKPEPPKHRLREQATAAARGDVERAKASPKPQPQAKTKEEPTGTGIGFLGDPGGGVGFLGEAGGDFGALGDPGGGVGFLGDSSCFGSLGDPGGGVGFLGEASGGFGSLGDPGGGVGLLGEAGGGFGSLGDPGGGVLDMLDGFNDVCNGNGEKYHINININLSAIIYTLLPCGSLMFYDMGKNPKLLQMLSGDLNGGDGQVNYLFSAIIKPYDDKEYDKHVCDFLTLLPAASFLYILYFGGLLCSGDIIQSSNMSAIFIPFILAASLYCLVYYLLFIMDSDIVICSLI